MATQAQITDLYRQYLGREPDAAGLRFYSNPDFSLDLIRSNIANSAEAKQFGALSQGLDVSSILNSLTPSEVQNMAIARDINTSYPITRNGVTYEFQPDGKINYTKLNSSGIGGTVAEFNADGTVVSAPQYRPDLGKTTTAERLLQAGMAATIGAALGPAGAGLLSTPAAAAAGTGLTTLSSTGGDVEAALKAAALAAGGAAAGQYLTGEVQSLLNTSAYDTAFAAADAARMANAGLDAQTIAQSLGQYVDTATATSLANSAVTNSAALTAANELAGRGLTATEISQVLQSEGISSTVAQNAASSALEGVTDITASDLVSNVTFQPQTRNPVQTGTSGATTATTGTQTGLLGGQTSASTGLLGGTSQVTVPGATLATPTGLLGGTAGTTTGAVAGTGGVGSQAVNVTGTGVQSGTGTTGTVGGAVAGTAGTAAAGTQTVDLQAKRIADVNSLYQTILGRVPDAAGLAFYSNPDFTLDQIEADLRNSAEAKNRVNITGSTVGTGTTGATTGAVTGATTGATAGTGATQTVQVEDRTVPRETASVLTPVSTGTVTTPTGTVPVTTYNVPTTQTTITNNPSISLLDQATIAALLAGVGGLLNQGGETTPTVSQDYINSIINAPRPTYGTAPFVPGVMPGVIPGGSISNVYAPFGGSMGYGAGRFGATVQPFALPGVTQGLLGTMGRPATPSGTSLL